MTPSRVDACVNLMPCAEMFFKCQETGLNALNGAGSMVCSITGAVYRPTITSNIGVDGSFWLSNYDFAPSNAVKATCVTPVPLASGTLPNFKRRHIITIATGMVLGPNARTPIGGVGHFDTSTGGDISISLSNGISHALVNCATGQIAHTGLATNQRNLPAPGTNVALIVEYTPNEGVYAKVIGTDGKTFGSGDTETVFSAPAMLFNVDVNPSLNNETRIGGDMAYYSIMAFSFDNGLPPDRDYVYQWLLNQHLNGSRVLPPWWRNEASTR